MPLFTTAQLRTRVTLEVRTVEAKNVQQAVMMSDNDGEIKEVVISDQVQPVADLFPSTSKTEDEMKEWQGRLVAKFKPIPQNAIIAGPEYRKRPAFVPAVKTYQAVPKPVSVGPNEKGPVYGGGSYQIPNTAPAKKVRKPKPVAKAVVAEPVAENAPNVLGVKTVAEKPVEKPVILVEVHKFGPGFSNAEPAPVKSEPEIAVPAAPVEPVQEKVEIAAEQTAVLEKPAVS